MNACELLSTLKKDRIYLPVIIFTDFNAPEIRKACGKYGVKAFLRKLADSEMLLDIITFCLPVTASLH
jgi:DNA-binding NarL/FixJ family response regulator